MSSTMTAWCSQNRRSALGLDLDPWQARVIGSTEKRHVLNCSRQAGKSTTAAVLALHESLYRPGSLTVLISPSQRQSSELFRKVIDLRDSLPWTVDLLEDNKLSMTVRGGGRVVSLPSSESTIRGYSGVTLLIEDEASRVDDELFYAVKPMLATTAGRHILMSTPRGKRGHFWEIWDQAPGWNKVRIPVTEVPRISPEYIEDERASTPEWWFLQEYMCEFMDSTDQVFGSEYVMAALRDDFEPFFGGTNT
jgi:hypothetical protein